jgi:hypothetical protein
MIFGMPLFILFFAPFCFFLHLINFFLSKLICDQTKIFTDRTKLIVDCTKIIFDQTKLFTDRTKLIYDQTKLFTDRTKLIYDRTKFYFDQLYERKRLQNLPTRVSTRYSKI